MHEVHETYCVLFIAYPIVAVEGGAKVSKDPVYPIQSPCASEPVVQNP